MVYKLTADRYKITPNTLNIGTRGSYGNDYIELELSDDWHGLIPKISFYPPRKKPVAVVYTGEAFLIPAELYVNAGSFKVIISGEVNERVMISLPMKMQVSETETPAVTPPTSPTPTEMQQVYDYLMQAVNVAQSVRTDADNGVFDGEDGYSPTISVTEEDNYYVVTVVDYRGTKHFRITKGTDGFSPTVTVSETENGYNISITDKNGTQNIEVFNGKDGEANYLVGDGLKLDETTNTLSVDTADDVEQDNTKPITSAAVYETVGNINALLATI